MSPETKSTSPQSALKNRRFYSRREVRSLAYIDMGRDNGGIVLNVSEGGLAIHTAVTLNERRLPHVRFQLPQSTEWIEARGEVAWTSETRMQAGIQLVGLTDKARTQIRDWVGSSGQTASLEMHPAGPVDPRPLNSLRVETIPTPAMPPDPPFPRSLQRPRPATSPQTTKNGEGIQAPVPAALPNKPNGANGSTEMATRTTTLMGTLQGAGTASMQLGLRLGQTASQPRRRPAWASLAGFVAFLAGMAVLSFFAGLRTGRGDSRPLLSGLFRSGARADSVVANQTANGSLGTNALDGDGSSTLMVARVTVSSRLYVPVSIPTRSDENKAGRLQVGGMTYHPDPQYPPDAQKQHTEGTVQLHAAIGANGNVENVVILSGPPTLVDAASNAVRQWRFNPTQLDGKAIATEADIAIVFWLRPAATHPHGESK